MELNKIIKEIGRGKNHARDIDFDTAVALYGAMLAGEVPDLDTGWGSVDLGVPHWRGVPVFSAWVATPDR